jgi:hypothetical protein
LPSFQRTIVVDSLYLGGSNLLARQLLIACTKSSEITGATSFIILFGILSGPGAFLFGSLQIVFSSSFWVTLLLIRIIYSVYAFPIVLLRSAWPVFRKNFSDRICAF